MHRQTGQQFAVKIVDVARFTASPGLSTAGEWSSFIYFISHCNLHKKIESVCC